MESRQEEINKLLLDPGFRNWALKSDAKDFGEWDRILSQDTELSQLAKEAKNVIIQFELYDQIQSGEDLDSFKRLEKKRKQKNPDVRIAKGRNNHTFTNLTLNRLVRIAAVLSFIVIFSGLLYFNSNKSQQQSAEKIIETVSKHTQNGQQLQITLPDGSKVKLNSNSSITYPVNFFKNRHIEFEGEAFFNVVRDETSPFTVKTENFETEVLGTSFNISAYKNARAKVSVVEGKVKVSSTFNKRKNYTVLEQKEAAEIREKLIREADFNADEILWKDGVLVFSNENIQGIAGKIQRWFNVTVVVKNEAFIGKSFSGKYSNESLEQILIGMGYALNFSFRMEGNRITIIGNKQKKS